MAAIPQAVLADSSLRFYREALALLESARIPILTGFGYEDARVVDQTMTREDIERWTAGIEFDGAK